MFKLVKNINNKTNTIKKIEFTCDAWYNEPYSNILPFNSAHIKEILNANKNDITEAQGSISTKGLLKLEFITETGKSIYYLPELRTT